jgi:hypothetical protein
MLTEPRKTGTDRDGCERKELSSESLFRDFDGGDDCGSDSCNESPKPLDLGRIWAWRFRDFLVGPGLLGAGDEKEVKIGMSLEACC